jgi:hypothetical protein
MKKTDNNISTNLLLCCVSVDFRQTCWWRDYLGAYVVSQNLRRLMSALLTFVFHISSILLREESGNINTKEKLPLFIWRTVCIQTAGKYFFVILSDKTATHQRQASLHLCTCKVIIGTIPYKYTYIFFLRGNNPWWATASSLSRLHDHTQWDTPHSVGILWTSDQPDAENSTS